MIKSGWDGDQRRVTAQPRRHIILQRKKRASFAMQPMISALANDGVLELVGKEMFPKQLTGDEQILDPIKQ